MIKHAASAAALIFFASPAFADENTSSSSQSPTPTTIVITLDNLNLSFDSATIEFVLDERQISAIMELLPVDGEGAPSSDPE